MQVLQGIGASPGVAIGEAVVLDQQGFRIPRRFVARDVVEDELARLVLAIQNVAEGIERQRDSVTAKLGEKYGAIFAAHLELLRDRQLLAEFERLVSEQHYSPEYAVSRTLRRYALVFGELDSHYHRERANDLFDLERGLLENLTGRRREGLTQLSAPAIVLAHNLTPSETSTLNRRFVLGFATEIGGALGHTAIVARGLEIPAVVGLGSVLTEVSGGDLVIVDGDNGRLVLCPDEATVARYRDLAERHRSDAERLEVLRDLPAETRDGVRIHLAANIEFPHEVQACLDRGCDGIGLYRTEFLYLGSETEPTEEDHYRAYSEVVRAMNGRPVVIRTLDLGADKMGRLPRGEEDQNPFLGLRSIRLSLRNVPLFRIQLRAILRASTLGPVSLMFPLITTLGELRKAKMVLQDAREDLEEAGVDFDRDIPVGMMVEVPSAVMTLDRFLPEVDFVSIGTNDLAQYALAVDRSNKDVAELFQTADPGVLRLIELALRTAAGAGVPATVCGQMSGHPAHAMMLLGLEVRGLSVPPSAVPEIKQLCRGVSLTQCREVARRALTLESAAEIDTYLREELKKNVTDFAPG